MTDLVTDVASRHFGFWWWLRTQDLLGAACHLTEALPSLRLVNSTIRKTKFFSWEGPFLTVPVTLLRAPGWYVRSTATLAVGGVGAAAAMPEFLAALATMLRDAKWAYDAVAAVGGVGAAAATPEILTGLTTLLRTPNPIGYEGFVAYVVGNLGMTAATPEILTALTTLLRTPTNPGAMVPVQSLAAHASDQMGMATPEILTTLLTLSRDPRWEMRPAAARVAVTPEVLTNLPAQLRDLDGYVQSAAAREVGGIGAAVTPEILAALAAMLDDLDGYVRSAAAQAIGDLHAKKPGFRFWSILRREGEERTSPFIVKRLDDEAFVG